jgi:hypothetical protein
MYYRDCDGDMNHHHSMHGNANDHNMMHGNMCHLMQQGMCPMNQMIGGGSNNMIPNNSPMNMVDMKKDDGCVAEKQLEMMYPESYYIIYPHVRHQCDMMEEKHGKGHCPCKEDIEKALDEICEKSEKELEYCEDKKDEDKEDDKRRRRYGRRRLLRDLAGVILINELIGRRDPFYGPIYGPAVYGPSVYGPGLGNWY